jgi:hypothetical protein
MALGYPKSGNMLSVVVSDGTGTPVNYTIDQDQGRLSISGLRPGLRESIPVERKGQFVSELFIGRKYPTASMVFYLDAFSKSAGGTILDWLFKDGALSARIGTLNPSGATDLKIPFAFDVAATIEGTDYGDSADHILSWDDWVIDDVAVEIGPDAPATVTISGPIRGAFADDLVINVAA